MIHQKCPKSTTSHFTVMFEVRTIQPFTLPKLNMNPRNDGVEDEFPFQTDDFSDSTLNFGRLFHISLRPLLPPGNRGIGDHAACAHDLGQITARHHSWWLIIDATLEASGAPEAWSRFIHRIWSRIGGGRVCCFPPSF